MINTSFFEIDHNANEFDFYEAEPLTDELLKKVEKAFQVKLPKEYIELMRYKNGGQLSSDYDTYYVLYVDPDTGENYEEGYMVPYLNGITLDNIGIGCSFERIEEWEYPNDIIMLNDEGHYCICLDYRNYKGNNPPVSYIDLELEEDVQIADSFEEFIFGLTADKNIITLDEADEVVFSRDEFGKLLKNDSDDISICEAIDYFGENESDSEWLLDQFAIAVKSRHVEVVERIAQNLIVLFKRNNYQFLYNSRVKNLVQIIVDTIINHLDEDVRAYSSRIEGHFKKCS